MHLKAKKHFGQHFLVNEKIANDIVDALQSLSHEKAVGVDGLKDNTLREAIQHSPAVAKKIANIFESWINGEAPIPNYVKTARTVFLSKTNSQYPPTGQVRTIAILPAFSKLYEVFLLKEIRSNIDAHHPLHPS